jgi:hypothetical protein
MSNVVEHAARWVRALGAPKRLDPYDSEALCLWRMTLPQQPPLASESTLSVDSGEAPYDANGVDRSLVRWMLRQSPAQRLAYAQGVIDLAAAARRSRNGDR